MFDLCHCGFQIQDKEMKRNHDRVSEIHRYVDHLRDELEGLQ